MPPPLLEPLTDETLSEFGVFLSHHLNPAISPEEFRRGLSVSFGSEKPNSGFVVRDAGEIVGGIGAIYSDQNINGRTERFCNITSWCVLEKFRAQSMRLCMAIVSQPGYSFTDLTPTEVVMKSLAFLKFAPLSGVRTVFFNHPWPLGRALTDVDEIAGRLPPGAAKVLIDHRKFSWLRHFAVGKAERWCHVVWKPWRLKGLPCADILYVSDPGIFIENAAASGHYLLTRHSCATTRIETRLLPFVPPRTLQLTGYRPKMYRSAHLYESQISNLYSELASLPL
jgi:hypothetical protein